MSRDPLLDFVCSEGIEKGLGMRRAVLLILACAAATLPAGCSPGEPFGQAFYGWNPIMRFDGVTYAALEGGESGRPLREDDLGPEFPEVRHDFSDEGPGYSTKDGDAAHLEPGTPVYEVEGYDPSFRLAARYRGNLTLYEAVSNPRAGAGADLLDIEGRVGRLSVTHGEDTGQVLAAFTGPEEVQSLVRGLLDAPARRLDPDHFGLRNTYHVVFHLEDGTTAVREYRTDTGMLGSSGSTAITTPESFREAIRGSLEGYLRKREALREASVAKKLRDVRACGDAPEANGTRTIDRGILYTTNDAPDSPSSGMLRGTDGADKLAGEGGEDEVRGGGGGDTVEGGLCDDRVYGGPGDDHVIGSGAMDSDEQGDDVLYGGSGPDEILGDAGDDVIRGEDGDDSVLYGGDGEDVLYGGDGEDLLDVGRDGQRDRIYCGAGRDTYVAEEIDVVADDCETETRMMVDGSS